MAHGRQEFAFRPVGHLGDFLGGLQLLLGMLPIGDIPGDTESANDLSLWAAQRDLTCRDPGNVAVRPRLFLLFVEQRLTRPYDLLLVRERLLSVLLRKEVGVRLPQCLGCITEPKTTSHGLVDPEEATLRILEIDVVGQVVHQRVEKIPFMLQRRFCLLALRDVPEDHLHTHDPTAGVPHRRLHHLHIAGLTVLLVLLNSLE